MTVTCPHCKQRGAWFDGKYGPFCSERCKLIDLGKWFNAENVIPAPLNPEMFESYEALENSPKLDEPDE